MFGVSTVVPVTIWKTCLDTIDEEETFPFIIRCDPEAVAAPTMLLPAGLCRASVSEAYSSLTVGSPPEYC